MNFQYDNKHEDSDESNLQSLKPISLSMSTSKLQRRSSVHYVRSRDELLVEQNEHFENLRRKIVKTRRTKIVGTVSASVCTYEKLKEMVQAGLNSFTINMAYCTPDLLLSLRTHRDALEKAFDVQLPITCVLKGTLVRIGALLHPEIFLRKGQEYRIVLNSKVLGTNLFCAVDDKEIIKRVKIGSQILVDYGQISMTIKRIEKSDQSIRILRESHNYTHDDFLETIVEKKRRIYPNLFHKDSNSCLSDYDSASMHNDNNSSCSALISEDEDHSLHSTHIRFSSNKQVQSAACSTDNLDRYNYSHFNHHHHNNNSSSSSSEQQHNHHNHNHDASHSPNTPHDSLSQHHHHHSNSSSTTPSHFSQKLQAPKQPGSVALSQQQSISKNHFADKLRKDKLGKKKTYDVIVCEVDSDCLLKAFKPIFIYQKDHYMKKENLKKYRIDRSSGGDDKTFADSIGEQASEDEDYEAELEDEQVVTPKDITDIHTCLDNDIDCICVSNVRSARDLKTVKSLIGESNKSVRLMARIQTPEAVENFEEIVKASDGVQIARGYLTVHMPVEKLFAKQKEMIHKCHEHLKPVFISCNILDSMVSSLLPTMCEVGEVSSLVSDYVDDILLTSETSCGLHPVDAIKTLSRICVEAEALRIMKRIQNPSQPNSVSIKSSSTSSKNSVSSCIINCALEAAYAINASIIVVFTSRGYTALKLSKLRPPCPIIAVTSHKNVARNLQSVSAINSVLLPSLIGTEELIKTVVEMQKQNGLVKKGDFVVITSGDIENQANQTNNLKIIAVQ